MKTLLALVTPIILGGCSSVLGLNASGYQTTVQAYCAAYQKLCGGQDFGFGPTEATCESALNNHFDKVDPNDVFVCINSAADAGAGKACTMLLTCSPVVSKSSACVATNCVVGGAGCCTLPQKCSIQLDAGVGPGTCQ